MKGDTTMADETTTTEETQDTSDAEGVAAITAARKAAGLGGGSEQTDEDAGGETGSRSATDEDSSSTQAAASDDQDESSELTDNQYNAARHLGYTVEEIASMPPGLAQRVEKESARLRKISTELGQHKAGLGDRLTKLEAMIANKDGKSSAATRTGTDAGEASKPTDGDNFDALSKQLGEFTPLSPDDVLDETTMTTKFNGLFDFTRQIMGQLANVRQEVTMTKTQRQHAAEQEMTRATQDFIGGLDHDIFTTFGRGDTAALPQDSPELTARTALLDRAKALRQVHQQAGEDTSMVQCLDEALLQLSPEKYKQAARKPAQETIDKIARSKPAAPSDKKRLPVEETLDTDEAVIEKIKRERKERGFRDG